MVALTHDHHGARGRPGVSHGALDRPGASTGRLRKGEEGIWMP